MSYGRRSVAGIVLLGLAVREGLSFWTGHPSDFELWVRLGFAVVHGINPYQPIPPVAGLSFANVYSNINNPTIAYLPFWPMVTGLMYLTFSAIGIDNRFLYYFLLKQPIIIGDVALGILLFYYVRSRNLALAKRALCFWMFCPVPIIIAGAWGMFDSIAMAFVVLALLVRQKPYRALWSGLAIFAKSIPIIFALPLTFNKRSDWKWFVVTLVIPLVGLEIFLSAERLPSNVVFATLFSTVGKGGESMSAWDILFYLTNVKIINPISAAYRILGIIWIPAILTFTALAYRKFRVDSDYGLVQSLLILILSFLIFKGRVAEQYSIYLLALSVIDVSVWSQSRRWLLVATAGVTFLYLLSNNFLLIRFLSPIDPVYLQMEAQISQRLGNLRLFTNLISGSAFTCLNLCYLAKILKATDKPRPEHQSLADPELDQKLV